MSYILDALKKAEAERHIGQVPGLHVQPAAALPASPAPARAGKLLRILGALLLAAGGALAWLRPWQPPPALSPTVAPVTASAAKPVTEPSPIPQIVAVSPPPEPPTPVVRETAKPRPAAAPRPVETKNSGAPAKPAKRPAEQPAPQSAPVPAPSSDLKLSAALTPEAGVASPGELPEQIQRELPNLAIGGFIYSDNPRERQLLVNKRLLHEGSEAAPGVKLEKMLPNAAVFSYKGYRYRLPY